MLKKRTQLVTLSVFLTISFILSGCYSSQQLVQPSLTQKVSRNPSFLDNITLHGSNRGMAISANSICRKEASVDISQSTTLQQRFAILLNVVPQVITNLSLYHFIDQWIGVRYRLGGTGMNGIDCSAFVQRAYEQVFGINLVRTALAQFNISNLVWNAKGLREGDLVFFKVHSRTISHVGIYLRNNFFVHASSSQGVMVSNLNDQYWQRKFACAGRVL